VDVIAERIQLLGGVSFAMAADLAETTQIERRRVDERKFRQEKRLTERTPR